MVATEVEGKQLENDSRRMTAGERHPAGAVSGVPRLRTHAAYTDGLHRCVVVRSDEHGAAVANCVSPRMVAVTVSSTVPVSDLPQAAWPHACQTLSVAVGHPTGGFFRASETPNNGVVSELNATATGPFWKAAEAVPDVRWGGSGPFRSFAHPVSWKWKAMVSALGQYVLCQWEYERSMRWWCLIAGSRDY